jgi:hypothetical protein
LTASSAGPFFQFIDDSRRTDLQYPSRVSDATAIEAHINHLLFDLRPAPFVSRVEDEGAARAVGRLTAVALLTGFSLAAFDDVITLTAGTAHRNKDHHSLLSKESVSMAYMAVEVQIWNTTHLQIRTLPRNAVASSMKAWPSPHLMKTTVSVIFVGMWIFPVDNSSRLIETSSLSFGFANDGNGQKEAVLRTARRCGKLRLRKRAWRWPGPGWRSPQGPYKPAL